MKPLDQVRKDFWLSVPKGESITGRFRLNEREWQNLVSVLDAAGYVIVPIYPAEEAVAAAMCKVDPVGCENYISREDVRDAWTAIVEARPK